MKVALFPADQAGCGYYRIRRPAAVAASEPDIEVIWCDENVPSTESFDPQLGTVYVPAESHADVMVFQRPARKDLVEWIRHVKEVERKTVVVDVDDDIRSIHPNHPFRSAYTQQEGPQYLSKACGLADLVTCTTPALAERYAPHGRFAVIPNMIPAEIIDWPKSDDGRTVGYPGAADMHPGDLEITRGGVAAALPDDWRFLVIGPGDHVARRLALANEPDSTGWVKEMADWHRALGQLTVGIVPLGDTAFNRAKSDLKGLELAARGVPFVASPTPEYEGLAYEGAGILAQSKGRKWRSQLWSLIHDESLRRDLTEQGRQVARQRTFEGNAWRWAEAWAHAHDRKLALA